MTIQATDVEQLENPSAPVQELPMQVQELPMQEQTVPPVAAPRARGRPAGSKDKQPRKRPARAAAWADEEEEETREPPRPPTRRSAPPKKSSAPRRRVQIVESASSASESSASEEEAPSPRTTRHRQWAAYRQQKTDAHQANVNRYAALFDRMLA